MQSERAVVSRIRKLHEFLGEWLDEIEEFVPKPKPKEFVPSREAVAAATYFQRLLTDNNLILPKPDGSPRPASHRSLKAMQLLHDGTAEIKGVPWTEAKKTMDWVVTDNFWRKNVLSCFKLREKYEVLRIAMNEGDSGVDNDYPELGEG